MAETSANQGFVSGIAVKRHAKVVAESGKSEIVGWHERFEMCHIARSIVRTIWRHGDEWIYPVRIAS